MEKSDLLACWENVSMKLGPRLRAAIEKQLFPFSAPLQKDDGIEHYRAGLVRFLLFLSLAAGVVLLIPEIVIGARTGNYLRLGIEFLFYLAYACLFACSAKHSRFCSYCIIALCLGMGTYHFIDQGLRSPGTPWLMAASMLGAVLFGASGGSIVTGLVALIFAGVASASLANILPWRIPLVSLARCGLTVVCLSLVAALSEAFLVRYLRNTVAARDTLNSELEAQQSALELESAERRGAEAKVSFYRDFDGLTRLLNREKFLSVFSQALPAAERRGRILAVLVVGLDRFGRVNESYGHAVGDAVLVRAAEALRFVFREDDVLGRLGNDLFAVLCTDVKRSDDVIELIEKVNRAFEAPIDANGVRIHVGASIGLALFPHDGREGEDLLLAAEAALHLAKEAGPGSYRLFDAVFNRQLLDRLQLEEELDGAIRSSAIEPWYQPKVDSAGRIVGVEALARWSMPDGTVRQPDVFIPAAERCGTIVEMGRIILEKACQDAVAWRRAGLAPIPVSVNLSPFQFKNPRLYEDVCNALDRSGLEPWRLELEITESGIEAVAEDAVGRLNELKSLGISLAIDDFGTGASSISRLRDYPVDTVKIPKSFVDPLPLDTRASMIARAVIDLAHNLEFNVVAEGVETLRQFNWLRDASCDSFQGYFFSRPLRQADFMSALATGFEARVK
jgi:diguanylate cyclase (GGDEF)-like protein